MKKVNKSLTKPYKSRQSFSKDLSKVRADLPSSPQKQATAVQGIASEYGYQFRSHEENTIPKAKREKNRKKVFTIELISSIPCLVKEMK